MITLHLVTMLTYLCSVAAHIYYFSKWKEQDDFQEYEIYISYTVVKLL